MIEKIQIRNVASYDSTGVDIDTNRKINFFFGYNGSGKSTIAKYLRDINRPPAEQDSSFADCSQTGFDQTSQTILVYNEDFRNENFILNNEQKGIFSLNVTNAEIDRQIQEINNNVGRLEVLLQNAKSREITYKRLLEKKYQDLVNVVFSKRSLFSDCKNATIPHGGSKKSFLTDIQSINLSSPCKTLDELLKEYHRVYANGLHNIPYGIDITIFEKLIEIENQISKILDEVIVGNKDVDIAALIDQLHMSSWVEQGLPYFAQSGKKCPFCQQDIINKDNLKQKFEHFFDASYKAKMTDLQDKSGTYYRTLSSQIDNLTEIVRLFNPDNKVSSLIVKLSKIRDDFAQIIREKKDKPNERKTIVSISNQMPFLEELKVLIEGNNHDFSNLASLKEQWIKDVQIYIAHDSQDVIKRYKQQEKELEKIIALNRECQDHISNQVSYRRHQVSFLRQSTVNTTDAVVNINKILKTVGFDGFEIKEKSLPNSTSPTYYIKRKGENGAPVYKTLSEGEKTFISFLYFHQLSLGVDDISTGASKKKIIVIDDPVSSLDSKVMFVISTLIHQLARRKGSDSTPDRQAFANPNIEQIFVFTHNFYFYKEVSFDRRPINTNQIHHLLEKDNNVTKLVYSEKQCKIKNDYTMMWDTLKRCKQGSSTDKSQNILIANTMRRIIDTYIEFTGIKNNSQSITWSALDSFTLGSPEYIVESAFISFINDESHCASVVDDIYYSNILRQDPTVIFNAFKALFKNIGRNHYEMMMDEEYTD